MKKLLFIFFIFSGTAEAKQIILEIPDQDIAIVEHDVVDAEQWIRTAWTGKLNNCKKRLVRQEVSRSVDAKEPLPAGDDAIVQKAFSRADYEDRKTRDTKTVVIPLTK